MYAKKQQMEDLTFKEFVERKLPKATIEEDLVDLLGTKALVSRRLNDPRKANHKELLIFADLLEVDAIELYERYDLAKGNLSRLEVDNLKKLAF